MSEENSFLTEQQLTKELEQDHTILKFILNRFSDRLPAEIHENRKVYDRRLLPLFIFINERLNSGMTPTEINTAIENRFNKNHSFTSPPPTPVSAPDRMEEFFRQFREDRAKLAEAQEKRNELEARKAAAMEKRAEAERQKADAMNHIARAIQEMKDRAGRSDKQAELAEKTAAAVTSLEEAHEPDDLLSLIDEVPEETEEETKAPEEEPQLDDLSALTADLGMEEPQQGSILDEDEIHDLAELLDDDPTQAETPDKVDLDDLSMLIDASGESAPPTDDLRLLIEESEESSAGNREVELDDLSLLVQDETETGDSGGRPGGEIEADDLSGLIDTGEKEDMLDDLSLLIEDREQTSLVPDISPDEDFEAYKQAIINIIIGLKQQGLTPEDTCERFNKEGVRTLSGKSRWSVKTISGIYRFIDSAA